MWWDFKHDLKRSFESCRPKKWENIRDKRLTKDEWGVLIEYCSIEEAKYLIYLYICSFKRDAFLSDTHISMIFVEIFYKEQS